MSSLMQHMQRLSASREREGGKKTQSMPEPGSIDSLEKASFKVSHEDGPMSFKQAFIISSEI